MDEVGLFMQMAMFMKANGRMIKHMGKVYILSMMDHAILENGYKICNMDMVFKNGMMDLHIKVSINKDVSTETENLPGQTETSIKGILLKT